MAHPVEEDQLACSAFDAGFSFKAPEESLNKEGERYRGSRLVEGAEWTAKNLYENSASVRLAAQGLSKVGEGLNWISEPLIQASEQNEQAPIYPGAMIDHRSWKARSGDAIKIVQGLVDKSEEGAEIRGNQFNIDPRLSRFVGGAAAEALLEVGAGKLFNRAKKLKINQNTRSPLLATVDGTPTRLPNLGQGDDFWRPSNVFASSSDPLYDTSNVKVNRVARIQKSQPVFADSSRLASQATRRAEDAGSLAVNTGKKSKSLVSQTVDGVKEWNITADQMPELKNKLEGWLRTEYKNKGKASKIKRKDFGTIIVDGDKRQITQITQFLEKDGKLPFPPKVVTQKANAYKRLQNTKPPKKELFELGRKLGLDHKQITEYFQEAQEGFGLTQEAARRQGLTIKQLHKEFQSGKKTLKHDYTPGKYHAGHYWPANKGGATSGRTAGVEPGKLNISKKDSFEGTINLYAAQRSGIPTTWAEDMKMWFRDKQGLPGPSYASDFTNAQRDLIESIPWHWNEAKVEAFWKKKGLDQAGKTDMMKDLLRELRIEKRYKDT